MTLADLHQHDAVQQALALDDIPRKSCFVVTEKGRRTDTCRRAPKQKEWMEVLIHGGENDIVIYDVCTYHFNRHLSSGVINTLGKVLG